MIACALAQIGLGGLAANDEQRPLIGSYFNLGICLSQWTCMWRTG